MSGYTLALILAALLFSILPNAALGIGWVEHANTTLASECPPNGFGGAVYLSTAKPYNFRFYCKNVTAAWSGGAFDSTRDRLYIWGGGHGDYFGNEIYAFDLSSKKMLRLTNPALPITRLTGSIQSELRPNDGTQPNSRHTYDGLAYMQHIDKVWAFAGSLASGSGGPDSVTWLFDPKTNTWQKDNPTGSIPRGIVGMVSAYDSTSRRVYVSDRQALYAYEFRVDAGAGHYTKLSTNSPGFKPSGNMVLDPSRQRLFVFGYKNSYSYDISKDSRYARETITTTGAETIIRSAAPGLAFDPVIKEIVGWVGDGKVYRFNPDTLAWASLALTGGPGRQHRQGTYGRFAYSPKQDRFVVYNRHNLNAFSLEPWRGKAETTSPAAPALRSRAKERSTKPTKRSARPAATPVLESPTGAADTYTDPSTAYPLGSKSFIELDSNSNLYVRFPPRKGGQLVSATLHLFSETQKDNLTVGVFRANKAWRESATRSSYAPGHAWDNPLGDWADRKGLAQGPEPYASERIADTDTPRAVSFDVTELVKAWDDGSVKNYGFVIRNIGRGGIHRFASRESSSPTRRPRLEYVVR